MQANTFAGRAFAWRVCVIGLALIGLLSCQVFAATAISSINVANKTDRVIISVTGNGPLKMVPLCSRKGAYLGFQFRCALHTQGRVVSIRSGRIHNVRFGSFTANPPATRIVVNTASFVKYSTDWSSDKHKLDITVWKFGSQPGLPQACTKAEPEVKVLGTTEERRASAEKPAVTQPSTELSNAKLQMKPAVCTQVASKPVCTEPQPLKMAQAVGMVKKADPEKKVSLNFLAADINDVLKALAVQSGYNIVSSKDVTGNITISLSDVTVTDALDYIAKLSGYSYTKANDTYLVGKKDQLRSLSDGDTEDSKIEVVCLKYVNVDDAVAFLNKEYPEMKFTKGNGDSNAGKDSGEAKDGKDAKAESTKRGGVIIISGPNAVVDRAKALALQVDESMKQLVGDVKTDIYYIQYADAEQLGKTLMALIPDIGVAPAPIDGFDLKAPEGIKLEKMPGGDSASGSNTDEKEQPQALVITGRAEDVKAAMDMAATLDKKSPQIKIEAKITSLSEAGEKKLGLSWNWTRTNSDTNFGAVVSPPSDYDGAGSILGSFNLVRGGTDLITKLHAIIDSGNGQLLASPSLLCLEGKPGVFFVGDEVTYVKSVSAATNGQTTYETDTVEAGVQLRVVGDVSPDGYVTLNLHPEVSVVKMTNLDNGASMPTVTRRFTDQVVRVKNGSSIVVGGLIRNEDITAMSKVPLLGDLPFFGRLFRQTSKEQNKSEVVMFITASIVQD